jgi:crossover junction endodeoxyribonuclease RuvC
VKRYVGIDPSTKTGLVVLDEEGEIWEAIEIIKPGVDPERMIRLIDAMMMLIIPGDIITIEGFANGAKGAYVGQMFGIGWGIRMALTRRNMPYTDVAPSQVKKFATGKGNASKEDMILPLSKRWGFENPSDNVRDAYIIAQIGRALHVPVPMVATQKDVILAIQYPPAKKPKKRKGESA